MNTWLQGDIEAIAEISAVPAILEVICMSTGMGFAAVARVTDSRWITCAVLDKIEFGLQPGDELQVETTICDEIRQSHQAVIIDDTQADPVFSTHRTPAIYGFRSYISVPIILEDGSFFGTLCAIDPKPAKLKNPQTITTFKLFANLISMHLTTFRKAEEMAIKMDEQRERSQSNGD